MRSTHSSDRINDIPAFILDVKRMSVSIVALLIKPDLGIPYGLIVCSKETCTRMPTYVFVVIS